MPEQQMKRLSNEGFMPLSAFRIFHQTLYHATEIHWHEFFEMAFIVNGQGTHLFNAKSYPLTRGSLFLLSPSDFHALVPEPTRSLELFNVIFAETLLHEEVGRLLFRELADHHVVLGVEECDAAEHEFRRLWSEVHDERAGQQLVIQSTLQRLLIDLARSSLAVPRSNHAPPSAQSKLYPALIYLHHHYREPLTLQTVAAQVALSPNYFSECFRDATGMTFQRYLSSLRLRFGRSLLSLSTLPVTEICYASGFQTLAHFERAFKREFGLAPTAWRSSGMKRGRETEE